MGNFLEFVPKLSLLTLILLYSSAESLKRNRYRATKRSIETANLNPNVLEGVNDPNYPSVKRYTRSSPPPSPESNEYFGQKDKRRSGRRRGYGEEPPRIVRQLDAAEFGGVGGEALGGFPLGKIVEHKDKLNPLAFVGRSVAPLNQSEDEETRQDLGRGMSWGDVVAGPKAALEAKAGMKVPTTKEDAAKLAKQKAEQKAGVKVPTTKKEAINEAANQAVKHTKRAVISAEDDERQPDRETRHISNEDFRHHYRGRGGHHGGGGGGGHHHNHGGHYRPSHRSSHEEESPESDSLGSESEENSHEDFHHRKK